MRALVYKAPNVVEVNEFPRPVPHEGEVEIAVEAAGICGSDVSGFLGHSARRQPPLILGHELMGRTVDGRRVVANPLIVCGRCQSCLSGAQNLCATWSLLGMDQTQGSFAEYVVVPERQVYPIPDHLSTTRAVLTEPLANIVHLYRILSPMPLFRVAIVGGGTMGALSLLFAQRIGARETLVADVNQERLDAMKQLGAYYAINTSTEEGRDEARSIAGAGFDVVIDASGMGETRQLAMNLCRPGSQVLLLGMAQQRSELDFVTSIRKEHRILMSFAYTPVDFERALLLLIAGEIALDEYSVVFPLEQGQEAFQRVTQRPGPTLKFVLSI